MDPFTFMSCLYTYGDTRKLEHIQKVASTLGITSPTDVAGIPSGNGQSTWFFPNKNERTNNEIERLWKFFSSVLNDKITDKNFADVLSIISVGKAKLTE